MRPSRAAVAAIVALAAVAGASLGARAQEAPPPAPAPSDSTLPHYLESLADSTDRYFGLSAARPDTAGIDSAFAYAVAHPRKERGPVRISYFPDFNFNRVDGPVWGAGVAARRGRRGALLSGTIGYAAGPNEWRWQSRFRKIWDQRTVDWTLQVAGGRETEAVDRDRAESNLATLRALLLGRDRRHYLRREGASVSLDAATSLWRLGVAYRDEVEAPLRTTTTWNLTHADLSIVGNVPAAPGRARELEFEAAWLMPWWPITLEAVHQTSGRAIDSDFEYRRTRLSASGKLGIGQVATLIPQFTYGRTAGELIPQAAHYLGGSHSLRSIPGSALGGSGVALARLDLIGSQDVLRLARIPHPEMLPIQAGLSISSGAVWGDDPYGGPTRPGVDWPSRELWLSEAGVSLFYQPGVPDPTGFIRLSYSRPLGRRFEETSNWTVSYTRALDLVRPFETQ